jgi:hypothetical protein
VHIENISRLITLLPVLIYLFRRRNDKLIRAIVFFNTFYIGFDFLYYLIRKTNRELGDYFNLFFVPLEYLFIYLFFSSIFKTKQAKSLLNYSILLFLLFWGITSYFIPISTFNSILNGLESLIVILLTLIYFYEEIKNPQTLFIYSQPQFWGVIGFFLFFAGSFFVFLYKQTHKQEEQFREQYIYIHSSLFILRNILFSIAMFVKPEKVKIPNERSSFT